MPHYSWVIIGGITMGTFARFMLLRVDYRQYPSYPQGYIIHLALGFIAASLGAVAVPAIVEKEYTAVTFLALAAQQFREIRKIERESLDNIEETELVARGTAYIEDIAKVFESRNYLAIFVSLLTSVTIQFTKSIFLGVFLGLVLITLLFKLMIRKTIRDIAEVKQAEIRFEGPLLMVDDIVIMNIGLEDAREIYQNKGLAITIIPKDDDARATLANLGQRQAISHDVAALLGIRKDVGEAEFTPLIRRNNETGKLGMAIIPMEPDIECLIEAVNRVPVLESSKRKPLQSKVGKKAAD